MQPGSQLSVNAVEGYPIEDFSAEAVRNQIAEAQKIASGNGSEQDIAEARIELEVRFLTFTTMAEILTRDPGLGEHPGGTQVNMHLQIAFPITLPLHNYVHVQYQGRTGRSFRGQKIEVASQPVISIPFTK